MRSLVKHRSVVIKKVDKGSCAVVWDHEDYIAEAERQLGDVTFIKMSILKKKCCKILQKLAISYLEILQIKGESQKKNWSILPNPQETADLVTFAEKILNGKLHFLCIGICCLRFTNAYLKFQSFWIVSFNQVRKKVGCI